VLQAHESEERFRRARRPTNGRRGSRPAGRNLEGDPVATVEEKEGPVRATCSRRVEEHNVEFIRFWFTDIFGALKSFAVGREELAGRARGGHGLRRLVDHRVSTGSRSRT